MKGGFNKWQTIDQQITEAFQFGGKGVKASDDLKRRIDLEIRQGNIEEVRKKGEIHIMRRLSMRKKVVIGLAAMVFACTACFAGGKVTSLVGSGHPDALCLGYEDIDKAEKELGFDIQVVKDFSNGYTFKNLDIIDMKGQDDAGNTLETYKKADAAYICQDRPNVSVYMVETGNHEETRAANETEQYEGITLSYFLTHYKSVPDDYERTEEDKANEEKGDLQIAYGGDDVIKYDEISTVDWAIDGVSYCLIVFNTDMTTTQLFDMAKEVIDAK